MGHWLDDGPAIADGLQDRLVARYDLPITTRASLLLAHLPEQLPEHARPAPGVREALLVRQGEDLSVSLFVEPAIMKALAEDPPEDGLSSGNLDAYCVLLEGVSHLTLLAWHAATERALAPVDLELQAEVDKFVIGRDLLTEQGHASSVPALHRALFRRWRLRDGMEAEDRDRYRFASDRAARYTAGLDADDPTEPTELKRFYRMSRSGKLDRIGRRH